MSLQNSLCSSQSAAVLTVLSIWRQHPVLFSSISEHVTQSLARRDFYKSYLLVTVKPVTVAVKCFTCLISFNLPAIPRSKCDYYLFLRWGERGAQGENNLVTINILIKYIAWMNELAWMKIFLFSRLTYRNTVGKMETVGKRTNMKQEFLQKISPKWSYIFLLLKSYGVSSALFGDGKFPHLEILRDGKKAVPNTSSSFQSSWWVSLIDHNTLNSWALSIGSDSIFMPWARHLLLEMPSLLEERRPLAGGL